MENTPPIRPAATVVLLRDTASGVEALLLRRKAALVFAGGHWVFPGGSIDSDDYRDKNDVESAARQAAVRETREEAGIAVDTADLRYFAHWTTPPDFPKRFATWFFTAIAEEGLTVRVDDGEIDQHLWVNPACALKQHAMGNIQLMPPTFVTLQQLVDCQSPEEGIETLCRDAPAVYVPRFVETGNGMCALYAEDVAYRSDNLDAPGPRHRLVMGRDKWRYERSLT